MLIAATQYDLSMKALDVYVSGCKPPHCAGCHNQELWEFGSGDAFLCNHSHYMIKAKDPLVERIMIMGGEPLDQCEGQLGQMIKEFHKTGKEIWLYTRYELEDVPESFKYCLSYVKTGKYDESLLVDDNVYQVGDFEVKLASSNQVLHKL